MDRAVTSDVAERVRRIRVAAGLTLAVATRGPARAPALLFAHGFGQSRHAWARAAEVLARRGWRTVTFDARGHGDSDRLAGGAYRLQQFVDDLLAVARSLGAPPVLVGASMGGLLGLAAADEVRPAPFRALVLVDITPHWEAAGVGRVLDFMRASSQGFASIGAAAAAMGRYLPERPGSGSSADLARLLHRGSDDRLHWRWDPALLDSVGREGERQQQRLLHAAAHVRVPILLVTGGRSDVVSAAGVSEFMRVAPHARHVALPGAGHVLADADNAAFIAAIEPFLSKLAQASVLPPAGAAAERRRAESP